MMLLLFTQCTICCCKTEEKKESLWTLLPRDNKTVTILTLMMKLLGSFVYLGLPRLIEFHGVLSDRCCKM